MVHTIGDGVGNASTKCCNPGDLSATGFAWCTGFGVSRSGAFEDGSCGRALQDVMWFGGGCANTGRPSRILRFFC